MKKLISAALSLALLLSLLTFAVGAGQSTLANVQKPDQLNFDILDADKWTEVSCISNFKNTDEGALIVYPDLDNPKTSMTFAHTFDKAVSADDLTEICLETRIASSYEKFSIKLSVYGKKGVYSDTTEGVCGVRSTVYFKLPENFKDDIIKLQFTVTTGNKVPDSCTVFAVYADNYNSFSYVDLYDTVYFTTISGDITYKENAVMITSIGESTVEANIAHKPIASSASVVISVSSNTTGIISVENTADTKKYQTALYSGTNDYVFFLDNIPEKLRISISHSDAEKSATIVLKSMVITELGESSYTGLGTVSSCAYSDGKVTMKGTITSDAAVQYIDSRLGIFRSSLDGVIEKNPIATTKISTVFEFSADEGLNSPNYRYTVAIISGDEIIPICEPIFATSFIDNSSSHSTPAMGLLNPSSFDAFKADASCVVIDVNANDLIANASSKDSVMFPYNGTLYSINSDYFKVINHDITFYNNLNCQVYLKINVAENNTYNDHTLTDLQAVLSYVASNGDGISGYLLLPDLRTADKSPEKAAYAAQVLGRLSETIRKSSPSSMIYYCVSENENVFTAHIAHYAKLYGVKGLSAYYTVVSEDDMIPIRASVDSTGFSGVIISAQTTDACVLIYDTASKIKAHSVVLNTESGFDINSFKTLSGKSDEQKELISDVEIMGSAPIWNFRDNYSTFGFVSGGDISEAQTVKTADARALRATLSGSSGVLLCRLDEDINLSSADGISLDFALNCDDAAQLELIIGYSNSRKVYSATAASGNNTLYAQLEKGANIEYIALAVSAKEGLTIDIASIGAYSSTLDSTELENSIKALDPVIQRQTTIYYIIGGSAVVLTLVIFILLTRKKEEKEITDDK